MTKIFVCGDVVNYENQTGLLCGPALTELVVAADYSICNFEAPIKGFGSAIPKSGPHLHQSRSTLSGLRSQGFNLILLANNHIMDYGREGLLATIKAANEEGLDVVGAGQDSCSAYKPLVRKVRDIRVGIVNACEAQFGVIDYLKHKDAAGYAWINHPNIDLAILKLKVICDFVLVFAHAGLENFSIPQKEWRARYKHLCDLGADVVIGSHPHVPQGYEKHNDSLIFYSLGNFYFDYGYAKNFENHSFSVLLDLNRGIPPQFELVHHITRDSEVDLCESQVDIDALCKKLGHGYIEEHNKMSLKAYRSIKSSLISTASPLPFDGTFKGTLREIAATVLGRRSGATKKLTQLHFIKNETYHYAATHALELLNGENYDQ